MTTVLRAALFALAMGLWGTAAGLVSPEMAAAEPQAQAQTQPASTEQSAPDEIPAHLTALRKKAERLFSLRQYRRAVFYARDYARKIGKLYGKDNPKYAEALRGLAKIYGRLGKSGIARKFLAEAEAIDAQTKVAGGTGGTSVDLPKKTASKPKSKPALTDQIQTEQSQRAEQQERARKQAEERAAQAERTRRRQAEREAVTAAEKKSAAPQPKNDTGYSTRGAGRSGGGGGFGGGFGTSKRRGLGGGGYASGRDKAAPAEDMERAEGTSDDGIASRSFRPAPGAPQKPQEDGSENYKVVQVFYGTDRKDRGENLGRARYNGQRGDFSYGVCEVSIPRDHKVGELESPSILRLEFRATPEKHVVLLNVEALKKDAFLGKLADRVTRSKEKQALVFVHGYNTSFEDAARRTAQFAHDLNFDGAPIVYSWPSQGTYSGYIVDESNAAWSVGNLQRFLKDVVAKTGAQRIHLIGHSMGNRVLARAFMKLRHELTDTERAKIKQLILAAPDIDADVFVRDIAPAITGGPAHITMYASAKDTALGVSRRIHGNNRAGDIAALPLIPIGMDVIDATQVRTTFGGHSFYADNDSILSDIRTLIKDGKKVAERTYLKRIDSQAGTYWFFNKPN